MPPHFFDPISIIPEIIYTLVISLICLMIFLKTKDAYNLTKHKGIMYFRDAFLLLGLAYIMRLIFGIVNFSTSLFQIWIPRNIIFPSILLILSYLSTTGIIYLIYSSIWKKVQNHNVLLIGHLIAIIVAVISFYTRSHELLIGLQIILLIILVLGNMFSNKKKKIFSQAKILHILIAVFWLMNLWLIIPKSMFYNLEVKMILQIISIGVFTFIYYRVLKWLK